MDILPLLDELQAIARNGLAFAHDPYDRERYSRLLELAAEYYGQAVDLPAAEARARLAREVGYASTKAGADAAVFDAEGRILLTLRADDEKWCLPCGWIEPGESPADAAVREAREETGYDVRVVRLVDVLGRRAGEQGTVHGLVVIIYLCEVVGGECRTSHESLEVRWWAIDEVPAWHTAHESYARAAYAAWVGGAG